MIELSHAGAQAPLHRSAVSRHAVQSLADAYRAESRLLDDLAGVLYRQQCAVDQDDLEAVDDTVFATHRMLVTLAEARRRRRSLNLLISGVEELDSDQLDNALGGSAPTVIVEAREALRASASALSAQVRENRRILDDAVERGNALVRAVYGTSASGVGPGASGYPSTQNRGEQRGGGLFLDRTA